MICQVRKAFRVKRAKSPIRISRAPTDKVPELATRVLLENSPHDFTFHLPLKTDLASRFWASERKRIIHPKVSRLNGLEKAFCFSPHAKKVGLKLLFRMRAILRACSTKGQILSLRTKEASFA